jgi:hypothetical protein
MRIRFSELEVEDVQRDLDALTPTLSQSFVLVAMLARLQRKGAKQEHTSD